jgi:5-methylcytosine-specific restriction endonuclease McrA
VQHKKDQSASVSAQARHPAGDAVKTCARHGNILETRLSKCPVCVRETGGVTRHSAAWRRYSKAFLLRHPFCERHLAQGVDVLAVDVHHKVDRAAGGALFPGEDGLEALCKSCHAREKFSR